MFRKIITTSLALTLAVAAAGCGGTAARQASTTARNAQAATAAPAAAQIQLSALQGKKVLIAYFSYSTNTGQTAHLLQSKTGGDFFAIEPETPYSTTDYRSVSAQGQREVRSGYKPPLKTKLPNINDYDVIFLGSPIWWATMAPPVATFLADYDLAGKTIVPFCTHAGYGAGTYFTDVARAVPQAKVLPGLALDRRSVPGALFLNADGQNIPPAQDELNRYPSAAAAIDNWLQTLQF